MIELTKRDDAVIDKALNEFLKNIEREMNIRFMREDVTFKSFFNNRMFIVYAIRSGISYDLFQHIKDTMPFTDKDWAEYLSLSVKSLQRFKKEKIYIFKPIHSEKIIELAEVTEMGCDIFDTPDDFYLWLNTPSIALGKSKPIELLQDSYGKELVIGELNRIEHGIFV